jgi:hypothetical protein
MNKLVPVVAIDPNKLYDYVYDMALGEKELSNKDAILCVMSLHHLIENRVKKENVHSCCGVGAGVLALAGLAASSSLMIAAGVTYEVYCFNKIRKSKKRIKEYETLLYLLEIKLARRYEDMQTAYLELSKLIQSIETEDLIGFFKEGGALLND